MKEYIKLLKQGLPASYSQIFFSDQRLFAFMLLPASFIDPATGLSGLICVFMSLTAAHVLGLNPISARQGYYSFNSLLTGLVLGTTFQFNAALLIYLLIGGLLSLLFTVWCSSFSIRYKVPFLSIPFIITIWLLFLSMRAAHTGIVGVGASPFQWPKEIISSLAIQCNYNGSNCLLHFMAIYFKAMAAIFFQHSVVAGIVISIGLLIYSRISFTLSLLGFAAGFLFFKIIYPHAPEPDFNWLSFNFILSAIAIGYFMIPSGASYLLVFIATLLTQLFISALGVLAQSFFLPLYSLPFSLVTMLLIVVLNNRYTIRYLHLVQYQLHSPEKNLYMFRSASERFKNDTYVHIHLPFFGEWFISQGHSGNITHKDKWRYAWDFVVTGGDGKTMRNHGSQLADYYCYSLPVTAPADGQVILLEDGIEDNLVGDVNLEQNWGNTIVLKHSEGLYSKLSHIKAGSFKVKTGDYIKKGDVLGLCGNSGRSPEPHIHFQLQATPFIGSHTLKYPLSYYIIKAEEKYILRSFDYPKEGETIIRPSPTALLQQSFHFIPGMKLEFDVNDGKKTYPEQWEVFTDISNFSYLYCHRTQSLAYFSNNGTLFYFTSFKGDEKSLLYYFYLAAYKVLLSYFPALEIHDELPVQDSKSVLKPLQDLIAPFHVLMKASFRSEYIFADNERLPKTIRIASAVTSTGISTTKKTFELEIENNQLKSITVNSDQLCIKAVNSSF
ncbi:MAG: hypothetical protein JWP12_352 [Bacteroidetes bacterium]|nr:hypothetical protein [Bacteroidota bacterium]